MLVQKIQRAIQLLKKQGLVLTAEMIYRWVFPDRLRYLSSCEHLFKLKDGLEIGGPSGIFSGKGCIPVYSLARNIDNCNFGPCTLWESGIREGPFFCFNKRMAPGQQYIAEACDLRFAPDNTYDFVISSHCIEHLANPLRSIREWIRVTKNGGILALVIPHKDKTCDHDRPVTSLDHLIHDFQDNVDETDMTHSAEILELHDRGGDSRDADKAALHQRVFSNHECRWMHHHVFDTQASIEMVNYMKLQILNVELFDPFHIVILARKDMDPSVVNNERYLKNPAGWVWYDPPLFKWIRHKRISK
ncbi:MAG: class I SAM-dependent methyltransferase [Lentisphaerae bacterium]|nr:class I SAM-dependent methyltransferase [Lentisphaerota bacterium]